MSNPMDINEARAMLRHCLEKAKAGDVIPITDYSSVVSAEEARQWLPIHLGLRPKWAEDKWRGWDVVCVGCEAVRSNINLGSNVRPWPGLGCLIAECWSCGNSITDMKGST